MRKFALLITLSLSACESGDPWTGTVQLDTPFELPYNGIATVGGEGLEITFTKVALDSRCPTDFKCQLVGEVVVDLNLATEADGETLLYLSTDWSSYGFPGTIDAGLPHLVAGRYAARDQSG